MDCCGVTNAGVGILAFNLTQLQQLNLSYCRHVSNKGTCEIIK